MFTANVQRMLLYTVCSRFNLIIESQPLTFAGKTNEKHITGNILHAFWLQTHETVLDLREKDLNCGAKGGRRVAYI